MRGHNPRNLDFKWLKNQADRVSQGQKSFGRVRKGGLIGGARELGLWPPKGFRLEEAQTAGGKTYLFAVPQKARVRLLLGTRSDEVEGNILIGPYLDEVILSDYLTEELGIIIVSFRRGLWRHKTDPPEITRGPP